MNKRTITTVLAGALALAGCAQPYNAGVYHTGLQSQQVELGRVLAVQRVRVAPGEQNGGALLGALGGAAAGNAIDSHGLGGLATTLAGALAGGWAGSKIEQSAGQDTGYQITVRLLGGPTIAVVEQGKRAAGLRAGECVQVVESAGGGGYLGNGGSKTRVMPMPSSACAGR